MYLAYDHALQPLGLDPLAVVHLLSLVEPLLVFDRQLGEEPARLVDTVLSHLVHILYDPSLVLKQCPFILLIPILITTLILPLAQLLVLKDFVDEPEIALLC